MQNYSNVKVYYFDIPGKGEAIRLALNYASVEFEDVRLTRDQFAKMKESNLSFGQLPCLEVTENANGSKHFIVQSATILRFIGRSTATDLLYPTDLIHASFIDSLLDAEIDLFTGLAVSRYRMRYGFESIGSPGEEPFDTIRKDLNEDVIPRHLGNLEHILEKNSNQWFGNTTNTSIIDFCLVPRLLWLEAHGEGICSEILKPYPKICSLMNAFYKNKKVAAYYETNEKRI